MDRREKLRRFRATETGGLVWRIATGILIFPLVWLALRPVFWLTMGDDMLARHVTGFHGDASSWQFWEMQRLLEWGADPNHRYVNGTIVINPLFDAVASGHIEVARLLLERGAHRDAVNSDGGTALDVACFYDEAPMANWLLSQGFRLAGVYEKTWDGSSLPQICLNNAQRKECAQSTQEEMCDE